MEITKVMSSWKDRAMRAPLWKWGVGLGVGAALLWFVFSGSAGRVGDMIGGSWDWTRNQLFISAVAGSPAANYADEILRVAQEEDISPILIYALGEQETRWGTAHGYKQDTGDWTMRAGHWVGTAGTTTVDISPNDSPPEGWSFPRDSKTGEIIPGPYAIPDDGLGWGRGLMQLDLSNSRSVNWRDPYSNIKAAVQLFKRQRDQLAARLQYTGDDLDRAAVVAYNHGVAGMVSNAERQVDWDTGTTGGDYSNSVLTYAQQLWQKVA